MTWRETNGGGGGQWKCPVFPTYCKYPPDRGKASNFNPHQSPLDVAPLPVLTTTSLYKNDSQK